MNETVQPDRVFMALADPRRRQLLEWLAQGEMSVTDLVARTGWNQPLVSKQLAALKAADLVMVSQVGRHRLYRARLAPLQPLVSWIDQLESRWQNQFDQLDAYLGTLDDKEKNND
ncbi:hypothetical protein BGP77_03940 [Saccharospirillum sp. MSK14-1]|uniref:ArsR/SmtB family transcription factor n=1 Tax=Saccharospirillum sp. MSK14-1 TaxID=1897632 RepID=UPI000D36CB8C|nr:metalloregulator ArsR/SmtB family transcription factor [Saccharospirillum sp. MSK14-1]PTY36460.1 hypothetical protein BGP77_03940 [Saccharospirillum sp. MSK14-1]